MFEDKSKKCVAITLSFVTQLHPQLIPTITKASDKRITLKSIHKSHVQNTQSTAYEVIERH